MITALPTMQNLLASVHGYLPGLNMNNIEYAVTGVTTDGKRFRLSYSSIMQALGINLYRGSVWEVKNGKRKLIKRVYN